MPTRIQVTPVYFQTHTVFAGSKTLGQCEGGNIVQSAVILRSFALAVLTPLRVTRAIKRIGDQLAVGRGIVVAPQSIGERVVFIVVDVEVAVHPFSGPINDRLYLLSGICFEHIVGLVYINRLSCRGIYRYRERRSSPVHSDTADIPLVMRRVPFVRAVCRYGLFEFGGNRSLLRQRKNVHVSFQCHIVHPNFFQLVSVGRFCHDSQPRIFGYSGSANHFGGTIHHFQCPLLGVGSSDCHGIKRTVIGEIHQCTRMSVT